MYSKCLFNSKGEYKFFTWSNKHKSSYNAWWYLDIYFACLIMQQKIPTWQLQHFWYVSNMPFKQKTQLPPITFNQSFSNTYICNCKYKKCKHHVIGRSLHIYQHVILPSNIELGKKHYTLKSQTCKYLVNHLWNYLNADIKTWEEILC